MKETGVDDQGLSDFTGFYPYPLYKDAELNFYNALGNRRLSIPFNPFSWIGGLFSIFFSSSRIKSKNISGNLAGEGILKGGVIIFGNDGAPQYAYQEELGSELPLEDILAAVYSIKRKADDKK